MLCRLGGGRGKDFERSGIKSDEFGLEGKKMEYGGPKLIFVALNEGVKGSFWAEYGPGGRLVEFGLEGYHCICISIVNEEFLTSV